MRTWIGYVVHFNPIRGIVPFRAMPCHAILNTGDESMFDNAKVYMKICGFDKFSTQLAGMPEPNLSHLYKIRIFCNAFEQNFFRKCNKTRNNKMEFQ